MKANLGDWWCSLIGGERGCDGAKELSCGLNLSLITMVMAFGERKQGAAILSLLLLSYASGMLRLARISWSHVLYYLTILSF